MKYGTAPALITTWVCSEVPEAMSSKIEAVDQYRMSERLEVETVPSTHWSSGFELEHVVFVGQERDESVHNPALNDLVDRRVLLF
jgi:hypothetical protein